MALSHPAPLIRRVRVHGAVAIIGDGWEILPGQPGQDGGLIARHPSHPEVEIVLDVASGEGVRVEHRAEHRTYGGA